MAKKTDPKAGTGSPQRPDAPKKRLGRGRKAKDPADLNRRQQIVQTYKMSRETDKRIGVWMLVAFVLAGAAAFGVFWLLPGSGTFSLVISSISAVLFGLLAAMIVFSRRAQKAAYKRLDGQTGAGARALQLLRRGWQVDEAIAFNRQQDLVHRVVGPPGIVLVGEGTPHRLRQLMNGERRKHERVTAETPIHEVVVGDGEGQVPLSKLSRHVTKLGRQVKPAEITDILQRLKALDAQRGKVPIPKGPMPTSMKGMRGNLRGR